MLRVLVQVGRGGAVPQQQVRCLFGITWGKKKSEVRENIDDLAIAPIDSAEVLKERFIPLTRRSLFRYISQEKKLLRSDEQEAFEDFAVALDNVISRRYQEQLQELKNLFDPINPDKETQEMSTWTRRQRLDNEFWLLQRLSDMVERANFRELTRVEVEKALKEHNTRHGITVSVDLAQYDVLKFWVLGRELPSGEPSLLQRVIASLSSARRPPGLPGESHVAIHKRVLLAVRMKRTDKLMLKLFKDVPEDALEQLLPEGKLSMTNFDKVVIKSTVALGVSGVLLNVAAWYYNHPVPWSLLISGVAVAVAVRAWAVNKSRRQDYLVRLNQLLYWHNVANNRGLLTLVKDRAEEEAFKEALLTFAFLHAERDPSADPGGLPTALLNSRIEAWLANRCSVPGVQFDSTEAAELLHSLGVVSVDGKTDVGPSHLFVPAPTLSDVLARLPVEPRGDRLLRPSPTEDEAFEGPTGVDIASRTEGPGWK